MEVDVGNAFEGYARLQSETYEFISRSIATHNWLEEAFRLVKDHPGVSGDDLYRICQPAFDRVYSHLFSPLLRPYRMMAFPFAESLAAQGNTRAAGPGAHGFADPFTMLSQWQRSFFEGAATMLRQYGRFGSGSPGSSPDVSVDGVPEATPFHLLSHGTDTQMETYFGALYRWLDVIMGDDQFVFPKPFVLSLQRAVSLYPRLHKAGSTYETMLQDAWETSMKKFTAEIAKDRGRSEFSQFFDAFRGTLSTEFAGLLRRPEFIKAQTDFIETFSEFIATVRKLLEAQMGMFPALPFVTGSQMESVARNMHTYKRRLDSIERKSRQRDGLPAGAGRVEELERKVRELEARLDAQAGDRTATSGGREPTTTAKGRGRGNKTT